MKARTAMAIAVAGGGITLASVPLMQHLSAAEDGGKRRPVYADKLAGGLPTACLGITKHTSPYPVVVGEIWSEAKCMEVGALVVRKQQLALADCITRVVPQPVFDALTSHGHNLGIPNTCASRAVALINAGRLADGCDAIAHAPDGRTPVWSYVKTDRLLPDGKYEMRFVQGLYNRRLVERAMCLRGISK